MTGRCCVSISHIQVNSSTSSLSYFYNNIMSSKNNHDAENNGGKREKGEGEDSSFVPPPAAEQTKLLDDNSHGISGDTNDLSSAYSCQGVLKLVVLSSFLDPFSLGACAQVDTEHRDLLQSNKTIVQGIFANYIGTGVIGVIGGSDNDNDNNVTNSMSNLESLGYYWTLRREGLFEKRRVVLNRDNADKEKGVPGSALRVYKMMQILDRFPKCKAAYNNNNPHQSGTNVLRAIIIFMIHKDILLNPSMANVNVRKHEDIIDMFAVGRKQFRHQFYNEYRVIVPANLFESYTAPEVAAAHWNQTPLYLKFLVLDTNRRIRW